MLDYLESASTETIGDLSIDLLGNRPSRTTKREAKPAAPYLRDADEGHGDKVAVEGIKTLEGGSRLLRNPRWVEIKESIRASGGLSDALAVTIRPGDDRFTCHSGGNTRLRAQQELYRETGDPAFAYVPVDVRPFNSDFELVALHHRENACRGDCTFFEEAWATYRMYKAFCDSQPPKTTARAFLERILEDYGLRVSAEAFSRIKYTVEELYQRLPTCLVQGGMSLRAVRRLIAMRTSLRKVWEARSIGTAADFDEAFYGLLARQDKDLADTFVTSKRPADQLSDGRITIDWEMFRGDMQHEIAVQAEINYQQAGAWIAAAFRECDPPSAKPTSPAPVLLKGRSSPTSSSSKRPSSSADLRRRACTQALEIGAGAGLEAIIVADTDSKAGYLVTGEPAKTASPGSWACWWLLVLSASPADEIQGYMASMPAFPSFQNLPADALHAASKLLETHARIARKEQG